VFGEFHAAASNTGIFMVRRGDMKYVHYVGYPPQLFDLADDPEETTDLAADPAYDQVREDLDRALREIVDPEAVDARAKADQAARIAAAGGRRAILEKGSFGYTPAPGEAAVYR
jgi:choline-sulfatase